MPFRVFCVAFTLFSLCLRTFSCSRNALKTKGPDCLQIKALILSINWDDDMELVAAFLALNLLPSFHLSRRL